MGLHPVLGRLLDQRDDGASAAGTAVLTYRFWTTALKSDPSVIGKTIRLGARSAEVLGVLEPSIPYPSETEIIANFVTSPHHLSATMAIASDSPLREWYGALPAAAGRPTVRSCLTGAPKSSLRQAPCKAGPRSTTR
jgi:putative ABC transport system permease protein